MAASRKMTVRAKSKHIGHACEGHLRGMLTHLPGVRQDRVVRALPFESPVEPDAVLLDKTGKVRAVFIVAFWGEAGSSHKKLHRTRTEFNESLRARAQAPTLFSADFQIVTVLYGAEGGWKEQILSDLGRQCAPMLFLPRALAARAAEQIVEKSFAEYCVTWESGQNDAREQLEASVAGRSLTVSEQGLLKLLERSLKAGGGTANTAPPALHESTVRLPVEEIRTRYRQGLGLLSLFPDDEVRAWKAGRSASHGPAAQQFARRAHFLGMGELSAQNSILGKKLAAFRLREPYDGSGRYEPHRPDFASWQALEVTDLEWILQAHREKTRNASKVFQGGAFDQCAGNVDGICSALAKQGRRVLTALRKHDLAGAASALANGGAVTAESWHPAVDEAQLFAVWAIAACALATARGDRAVRTQFDTRRQSAPDAATAKQLAQAILAAPDAINLFESAITFSAKVVTGDLVELAGIERPRLFSLDEPCSWLADVYMTLTTNSSHNPLNEILRRWLERRFPQVQWQGWPAARSVSPTVVCPEADARRQWCVVGRGNDGTLIAAETKAVTANNWGNKSKELYDKVAELRRVAVEANRKSLGILLFDGDLPTEVRRELSSGIGHDEVWSVDEVLAELRGGVGGRRA